ncbi:restriction endonuclease subunit S [Vibrio tetraodonis]|uniref:restriction endonuclease subunit S n=1 Tax=Vibrio tetraodonis TaxID=2231647 RepID=UPI001F433C33|nr:restriction endonuclease subunit S [Vibrio tetraodonis]
MEKLKDCTKIRLGMTFKSAIKDMGEQGIVSLIQAKDILPEGLEGNFSPPAVKPESNPSSHIISKGEILIRLRGPVFSSMVFDEDYQAVTTNQVAVISCDLNKLNPYYLNWYLNSKHGKRFFQSKNEGSNINKISSTALGEMEMNLPNLETQQKIAELQSNWFQQRTIYQRLISTGDTMNQGICDAIYMGKNK